MFLIVLENKSYDQTFGDPNSKLNEIAGQGVRLTHYWGIGHNSMDNYIAMISGQAPNPATQMDCPVYVEVKDAPSFDDEISKDLEKFESKFAAERLLLPALRQGSKQSKDQEDLKSKDHHKAAVEDTSRLLNDPYMKSSDDSDEGGKLQRGVGCIYQKPTIADQLGEKGWRAYMKACLDTATIPRRSEIQT